MFGFLEKLLETVLCSDILTLDAVITRVVEKCTAGTLPLDLHSEVETRRYKIEFERFLSILYEMGLSQEQARVFAVYCITASGVDWQEVQELLADHHDMRLKKQFITSSNKGHSFHLLRGAIETHEEVTNRRIENVLTNKNVNVDSTCRLVAERGIKFDDIERAQNVLKLEDGGENKKKEKEEEEEEEEEGEEEEEEEEEEEDEDEEEDEEEMLQAVSVLREKKKKKRDMVML